MSELEPYRPHVVVTPVRRAPEPQRRARLKPWAVLVVIVLLSLSIRACGEDDASNDPPVPVRTSTPPVAASAPDDSAATRLGVQTRSMVKQVERALKDFRQGFTTQ